MSDSDAGVKKKSNFWRTLALVLLAYSALNWYYDPWELEYNGYCKADGKTRDPHALMDVVVTDIIKKQANLGAGYVQYSSVQDFYGKNTDTFTMYAWFSPHEIPWWLQKADRILSRWLGYGGNYQLSFIYKSKIDGAEPNIYSVSGVDSCGKIVERSEIHTTAAPPPSHAYFSFETGHPSH